MFRSKNPIKVIWIILTKIKFNISWIRCQFEKNLSETQWFCKINSWYSNWFAHQFKLTWYR
jgi:hypothetical protein